MIRTCRWVSIVSLSTALVLASCGGSATEAYDGPGAAADTGDLPAVPKGDGEEGVRVATAYFTFQGVRAASLSKLLVELKENGRFLNVELAAGPQRARPVSAADVDESVRFVITPAAPVSGTHYEHASATLPAREERSGYFLRLTLSYYEDVDGRPVLRTVDYGHFTEDSSPRDALGGDLYKLAPG